MTTEVGTRRILLVEDHHDTARAMARLLNMSGFQVHTADCFAAALRLCEQEQFDLVISDVGLPDGSGYDLMRQMLNKECTTKGIAVSGYGTEQDVKESLSAGFSEHLVKPVEFDALRDAIRRLISY
jgi:DNA-binding response OmpR family regulator